MNTHEKRELFNGEVLFKLIDTYGLPLDMALMTIHDKKLACDWEEFIEAALNHGWDVEQIYKKINYAVSDSFIDKSYKKDFDDRLKMLLAVKATAIDKRQSKMKKLGIVKFSEKFYGDTHTVHRVVTSNENLNNLNDNLPYYWENNKRRCKQNHHDLEMREERYLELCECLVKKYLDN